MKDLDTENVSLYYLPGSKYDTVEELYDGSIKIHPYSKKYFNFPFKENGILFHYNSITGCITSSDTPASGYKIMNCSNAKTLAGRAGLAKAGEYFCLYNPEKKYFEFYSATFILEKTIAFPGRSDNFTFYDGKFIIYDRILNQAGMFMLQGEDLIFEKNVLLKGTGNKSFCINNNELWITDSEENLIYVYSFPEFSLRFQLLTPFFDPQSLVFFNNKIWVLYGGEVNETSYNQRCWAEQKPFYHILKYNITEKDGYNYTLTNAFKTEFTYEENIVVNKNPTSSDLSVFIALPMNTKRQELLGYEILGHNGSEVTPGQLEINLKGISGSSGGYIGYKAMMKLSSIKYTFFKDFDKVEIPPDYTASSCEKLMTGHSVMRELAKLPECGILEGILSLRNRVFDKLFYKTNSRARDYVEVLRDGYGTCGDFASVILSIAIINGYPVRTCGGYKVPRFTNSQQENRSCYYNHTWLEMYIPDAGWIPFESSADDREFSGRLSEGQFMGEDWSHIRTHFDKAVPNMIFVKSDNDNVHPFDLFENNTFMKITGEYPLPGNE